MEGQKFKLADILFGIVIPLILVLLIYVLAVYVNPSGEAHVLGTSGTLGTVAVILSQGFAQMIVLGIPLVLGLLWNKWAGGAAGFIMGGMYYVAQRRSLHRILCRLNPSIQLIMVTLACSSGS